MNSQTREGESGRAGKTLLAATIAAAVAFRLWLIAATDFPINDGALFLEFVRATAASFPGLPVVVGYNGFTLPFAYPPLSFWLSALLTKSGADALAVVHILPIAMNIVYVLLIALLLLKSGRGRMFAALAFLFFCVRLRSFEWLVMGGGLSRGLGSIFFVAMLLAVTVPRARQREAVPLWRMGIGGALVGGAILSHLEWGVLAAATLVVARALGARTLKEFLVEVIVAGAAAVAIVLPWVLLIYDRHGLEPFLAAGGTSSWSARSSIQLLIELARPAIANPFIVIGGVVLLVRRDLFWFGFVLACVFLTPRHSATPLALPLGIFAAQGVLTAWPLVERLIRPRWAAAAALVAAIILVVAVNGWWQYRGTEGQFRPLAKETREGMAWVAQNHSGARVAVLTTAPWFYDSSAEWFPVLAQARSTTTVQGREWLPNQAFATTSERAREMKHSRSCTDLPARLQPFGRYDLVWAETMQHCFAAPAFTPVYRNSRVTIFRTAAPSR